MLMDTQRKKEQEQALHEHSRIGEGLGFERTRRITGYLVGTLDRFNNAKQAEERDRVKHSV
jgi:anaerobic ribonucleoside-triphosphate reductase